MFGQQCPRVARSDEAAANQHAVPIADAQVIFSVNLVDSGLDGVRKILDDGHAVRAEHAHRNLLQLFDWHDAVTPGVLGDDDLAQNRLEHAKIFLDLLVTHHGDHADQLLEAVILLDCGAQGLGGVHVVPAIDNDCRGCADLFDATRYLHAAERLIDQILVKLAVDRNHGFRGGKGCQGVMRLMFAEFRDRHVTVFAFRRAQRRHLAAYCRDAGDDFHLLAVANQRGVVAFRCGFKNRHDLLGVRLTADNRRAAGLDDA